MTRRCADLTELLAAAEAGLGRLAVVSGDLDLLDREAIELLHRAGVRVVGIGDATARGSGSGSRRSARTSWRSRRTTRPPRATSSGRRSPSSAPHRTARRSRRGPTSAPIAVRRAVSSWPLGSDGRPGPHDRGGERGRGARRRWAPDPARGRRHLRRERRAGGRHAGRGTRARRSGTCCRAGHPRPDDARPAHPDHRPRPAGPVRASPGRTGGRSSRPRRSTPYGRSRGGSPSGR